MIKTDISEKFSSDISGRYISHIHTTFSDGLDSVEDYCRWASDHTMKTIVFSEHVRKELSFNFNDFTKDIKHAEELFPALNIWVGVESKLLPGGTLDIPDEITSKIQVIFFACHSFPQDIELYKTSLTQLFSDKIWKKYVRIWAHPGNFFKYLGLSDKNTRILRELIELAVSENILIENNIRYHLPPEHILKTLHPSHVILGYDAHSIDSLGEIENYFENKL